MLKRGRKKLKAIYLFGIIFIVVFIAGCAKKPEKVEAPPYTIVFFGDSITFGYGVDTETESFFARIKNIMQSGMYGNVRIINSGVSGDDTSEALSRVTTDVTAHNPDLVVIAFGLNDCQNKSMTSSKFRANILNMMAAIPSKTRIILATSNTFLDTGQSLWKDINGSLEPYMDEVRAIASEKNLTLIDVNRVWENQLRQDQRHMESFYVDPTHPSVKGHRLIYETYMNVLRRVIRR